jgi:DNA-binding NtrC family response regulator
MHARTCTILLLEDEPLILMDLEFAAEEAGCLPLCASAVSQALRMLGSDRRIDVAILDVSLKDDETCLPVAHALQERGIPFLLHSGDLDRTDEKVRELDAVLIAKPASADRVVETALDLTRQTGRQGQEA